MPTPARGPASKREGEGFVPTATSLPNANTVFGEDRKQGQASGKRKDAAGLGSTLAAEHCGGGDVCPGGGTLPTSCRQADNVPF